MFFFVFFFAFFGVFSKVKGTAFVGSETDRFFIAFSCTAILVLKKAGAKLQRMKNGFHQNALFTISLQTQVSLR